MNKDTLNIIRHSLLFLVIGLVVGCIIGAWMWSATHKPGEPSIKIERDTVTITDTVPDYTPAPKDSALVRWLVVRVPVEQPPHSGGTEDLADNTPADTMEVELPVTQKHYQSDTYQAWVSGYQPNLDSIEVYQRTQTITETITITQESKPKPWGIGIAGGCQYLPNTKQASPYAGLRVAYSGGRWGADVTGGYMHDAASRTGTPYINGRITYNIFTF